MEKDFNVLVKQLLEESVYVMTREEIRDFANRQDDKNVTNHILDALNNSDAEYFSYDRAMGVMVTPRPLKTLEDLENYLEW